jgi:cytidylate kinase
MYNVVTIAREYGSGGADIGRIVAEMLNWECIDKQIIERVSARGKVDVSWAESADEHASAWWEKMMNGFRKGGPYYYAGEDADIAVDHDTMQQFTAGVIQEAAKIGNCVIIGRSSGCILRNNPHVFRVLVYAPLSEKLARMKLRHPQEKDLRALLQRMDDDRSNYAMRYYECDPANPRLYHLCVNSTMGLEFCAAMIAQAVRNSAEI